MVHWKECTGYLHYQNYRLQFKWINTGKDYWYSLNIGRHHQGSFNRKGMEKIGESKKKENGTRRPKLSNLQRWDDSLKNSENYFQTQ
jgi:hypothetical protein